MEKRVVVSGVFGDDNNSMSPRSPPAQLLHELEKRLGVEFVLFQLINELAVAYSDGAEIPNPFSRRVVKKNRVLRFWWYPHSAP
jgi:hypothetical protein